MVLSFSVVIVLFIESNSRAVDRARHELFSLFYFTHGSTQSLFRCRMQIYNKMTACMQNSAWYFFSVCRLIPLISIHDHKSQAYTATTMRTHSIETHSHMYIYVQRFMYGLSLFSLSNNAELRPPYIHTQYVCYTRQKSVPVYYCIYYKTGKTESRRAFQAAIYSI